MSVAPLDILERLARCCDQLESTLRQPDRLPVETARTLAECLTECRVILIELALDYHAHAAISSRTLQRILDAQAQALLPAS